MKKLIVIILVLVSEAGFSQSFSELKDKLVLGVAFSPDFYLSPNPINLEEHRGYTFNRYGFNSTTGLVGKIKVRSRLAVGTGIAYSQKDFSSTYFCTTCRFFVPINPVHEKLRYLEVPTFLLYQILDRKVDLFVKAGLASGFLISEDKSIFVGEHLDKKRFLLSGQLGFGANLDMGKGVSLILSPIYRHSLTKVMKHPDFEMRAFGLETGFAYGIK